MSWTTGVQMLIGAGIFSLHHCVLTSSGVHPTPYPMGAGIKWPWCEADHSPPSSAKVKNTCSYIPPLPHMSSCCDSLSGGYVLMVWYLVKNRDNFAFVIYVLYNCQMCWNSVFKICHPKHVCVTV